jgi:tetrahydromethanopterin S-methyltransferase subunit G
VTDEPQPQSPHDPWGSIPFRVQRLEFRMDRTEERLRVLDRMEEKIDNLNAHISDMEDKQAGRNKWTVGLLTSLVVMFVTFIVAQIGNGGIG